MLKPEVFGNIEMNAGYCHQKNFIRPLSKSVPAELNAINLLALNQQSISEILMITQKFKI